MPNVILIKRDGTIEAIKQFYLSDSKVLKKIADQIPRYFRLTVGNGNRVDMTRNPTSSDRRGARKKFCDEFPGMNLEGMYSRTMADALGNEYFWMAGDALHLEIKESIGKRYGIIVNEHQLFTTEEIEVMEHAV